MNLRDLKYLEMHPSAKFAKSMEISAHLTVLTLDTQFFMTPQSHMMDTPSVAPRTTSTTSNGTILIPSAFVVHIHPIQLEQKAQAFDHLDDCDIFKGHSHVY